MKVARDEQDGENQVLAWTRDDWRCRLDAGRPERGPTEIWLRCGKTAAKAVKR